jgi:hypothetical protein
MVKNLALNKSAQHYSQLATYMTQCEAKEWKSRYKAKVLELGKVQARTWWDLVKNDILKIRGQDGLNTLIEAMNNEKSSKG